MKQKFKDAGFLFVFCNGVTPLIPFFRPEKGTVKRILISGDHRPELGRYYKKTQGSQLNIICRTLLQILFKSML